MSDEKTRVWDPYIRVFHWSLASAFLFSWLTEDDFLTWHTYSGYFILGLILFRLVWGVIGTPYAKFSQFVYPPSVVTSYVMDVLRFKSIRYIGHNPAGGIMILALIIMLLCTIMTGLLAYGAEGHGLLSALVADSSVYEDEIFEELHEFCANFCLLLVVIHLIGVLFESLVHRENLILSMITGKKRNRLFR